MSVFKDTNSREWRIRLTGPKLQKVREATEITLATPSGQGALAAVANGEILTRVLWLLCGDQKDEGAKLTPEQFGEAVASGEVFEAARVALHDAIVDFTPPSQREMLQAVLTAEQKEQAARSAIAIGKMNGDELHDRACRSFQVGLENQFDQLLTRLENAGDLLALPESTPTTPPTES
jgi:hypothetical protein